MKHSIRFFVQPRFGGVELNFREMDSIPLAGDPTQTAIRFPNMALLREHILSVGLPENFATMGEHAAIDISREKLRELGFDME